VRKHFALAYVVEPVTPVVLKHGRAGDKEYRHDRNPRNACSCERIASYGQKTRKDTDEQAKGLNPSAHGYHLLSRYLKCAICA
ncbi:MAG: hypothetical protein AAB902_01845, partial [Patescibacteria group bacterium]